MNKLSSLPFTILFCCSILVTCGQSDPSKIQARISIRIVDESGNTTPARVWIDVDNQRFFQPIAPETVTVYANDQSFSCDGVFTMEVPAGNAVVHVEKGKEYTPVDLAITLKSGETIENTIELKRWIDLPSEGWYSADLHVHLGQDNPRILQQLALADDVHLMPAFTYWLGGQDESWHATWPDETYTAPIVIDDRHLITRNNIEIERIGGNAAIGATFLFNLDHPVTARQYGEHFPTDAALCRIARTQSPGVVFDSDKPLWAETVIGAALEVLDTIQVCHNHYHRWSTVAGGWGMIGPLSAGESNAAVGDGLFHRTNNLYYRFLNCGFRLGVSGGSAIGVMEVPSGFHRVYARINGPLTAEKMWASIKAGRSFVTTGPMLTLDADGRGPGATISRTSSDTSPIQLTATLRSIETLESLQLVHNGLVVATMSLLDQKPAPILRQTLTYELYPKRSGWIAARALYRAPDGLLRQAHTSPVYLSVDEKPTAFAEDATYMLRWIQILDDIARSQPDRFPSTAARQGVLADYEEARTRYEQVIQDAQRHWGDQPISSGN